MATFNYLDLRKQYNNFLRPLVVVKINGKDFTKNKFQFMISDIEVENTCDFEASIASFVIYNCFNSEASRFMFKELKEFIALGSSIVIYLGYEASAREVFRGFIAKVNFEAPKGLTPGVRITAMDVKGLMMSGSYSKQLLADNYGDAVEEILKRTNYEKIKKEGASGGGQAFGGVGGIGGAADDDGKSIITRISIDKTPDKQENSGGSGASAGAGGVGGDKKVTDRTIEMVSESDYEFVVKAAKKFNYEFFSVGGHVKFRKAKSEQDILMVLGPETGMRSMDSQFDITGLVGSVEVRGIDVGKGQLIKANKKLSGKISQGSYAKGLVSSIEHVVVDPTIASSDDATNRAEYIAENISYRLGTLNAEFTGMPEIVPGRFIVLQGLGFEFNVKFYIVSVTHIMNTDENYITRIVAKAAAIENTNDK